MKIVTMKYHEYGQIYQAFENRIEKFCEDSTVFTQKPKMKKVKSNLHAVINEYAEMMQPTMGEMMQKVQDLFTFLSESVLYFL